VLSLIGENGRLNLIVYQTLNDGWDGRFKGSEQPSGVFEWIAKGKDITGKAVIGKGTMALI